MKAFFRFGCFLGLLLVAQLCWGQSGKYRYSTLTREEGSAFFALDGSSGQLYFMNDYGTEAGIWKPYGGVIRLGGRNNLQFATIAYKVGSAFYALEAATGQLWYMNDYGDQAAVWKTYGKPIRAEGRETQQLQAEDEGDGTKITSLDASSGQVYYMFDYGSNSGTWLKYGTSIK